MLIHEVLEKTGLTKKAVAYYEKSGLLNPTTAENRYRDYSSEDVRRLREIAVLRALGLAVEDIKTLLESDDKKSALTACRRSIERNMEREKLQTQWLEKLSRDYTVEQSFEDILSSVSAQATIAQQLERTFPGTFGLYLSWHFGRFLNDMIQTPEQRRAFQAISAWLDGVERFDVPEDLQPLLEGNLDAFVQATTSLTQAMRDVKAWTADNAQALEAYREYRLSDEYIDSPAGRLRALILDFQSRSGYQEIFLENMKALSPSYREYSEQLRQANEQFLKTNPSYRQLEG
jgi:DNA-binding transcriptional MerR regulator